MKEIILLITILFTIASCKKIGNGEISGIVTERGTGLPFSNVEVKLERTTRSGENGKTYPAIIASTVTDNDGNFTLPFHMKLRYKYRVYCEPDERGTYSGADNHYLSDKNEKVNLTLPPYAYVKIILHKTSSTVTQSADLHFDDSNTINLEIPNHPFDTTQGVYRVKGEDSVLVFWSQTYNTNFYTHGSQKLYIPKGDTVSYDINLE